MLLLQSDSNDDFEQRLPKDKLVLLVGCSPVVVFMCQCDYMLYQCIVDVLIPEVLRHIPGVFYYNHYNHYMYVDDISLYGNDFFVNSLCLMPLC